MREPWGYKGIIPGRGSITSTGLICTQKPAWLRGGSPRLETVEELDFALSVMGGHWWILSRE